MNLQNPDHPIWSLARLVIICSASLGGIYIGATEVDAGELKGWAVLIAGAVGAEGWRQWQIRGNEEE
ncbi:hypothetical protein OAG36_00570 [bacterium]|nr:hypothetical protein [bacterium]